MQRSLSKEKVHSDAALGHSKESSMVVYIVVGVFFFFFKFLLIYLFLSLERGEGRERERERNISVQEKHQLVASLIVWPATLKV